MIKIKVVKSLGEEKIQRLKKHKKMTAKDRDELFGDKAGRQLAIGITEEDEELEELNVNHDEDGKFTDKKSATCKSDYFQKGGSRTRVGGSLTDPDEAGRGRKKNSQGRWICKSNRLKWEESKLANNQSKLDLKSQQNEIIYVPQDPYDCAVKIRDKDKLIKKLKLMVINADKRKLKNCPLSVFDAMKLINALELSTKGKLNTPQKSN